MISGDVSLDGKLGRIPLSTVNADLKNSFNNLASSLLDVNK